MEYDMVSILAVASFHDGAVLSGKGRENICLSGKRRETVSQGGQSKA